MTLPLWLALLTTAASAASVGTPARPIDPATWVLPDDYPPAALFDGKSGKTRFRVSVDLSGRPDTCGIMISSGSQDLDLAACRLVLSRGRFNAATDAEGRPIRGSYSNSIDWILPERKAAPWQSISMVVRTTFDSQGQVTGCKTEGHLDAQSGCALLGQPAALAHMVPLALEKVRWIEVRLVNEASGQPIPDGNAIPQGAARTIISRSTTTVDSAGKITACHADIGKTLPEAPQFISCAASSVGQQAFVPTADKAPRAMRVTMEVVWQPR